MTQIPTNLPPSLIFFSTIKVITVSGLVPAIRAATQKTEWLDLGSYNKATLINLLGLLKDLTIGERGFNIVTVVDMGNAR